MLIVTFILLDFAFRWKRPSKKSQGDGGEIAGREAINNLGFEKKAAQQMMTRIAPTLSGVLTILARDDICLISKPLAILVNTHVGHSPTLLEARVSNRLVEVC